MTVLKYGDKGADAALMQLGLTRAGFPAARDGIFGAETERSLREFQTENGLRPDGVYGPVTERAMYPWYVGYASHRIRSGDTLYKIARSHGSSITAIETANPGVDPLNLHPGESLTVPLPFPVVPTDIPYSSRLVRYAVMGLSARYPFITRSEYGRSVMGRPLHYIGLGNGERTLFYNAEHHANEWITTPLLLRFAEELAKAYAEGGNIYTVTAAEVMEKARIFIAPAVNPDGMDLVAGALSDGPYYLRAKRIAADFPAMPFPDGWKANIMGTDPNLQYPAGWEEAREIKFAQGFDRPAPRDYVGVAPLSAPESRAVYELTKRLSPALTLSYHTQGNVIYWRYLSFEPPGSRRLGQCFAAASGYLLEETPYASGFAGYKDWFISEYDRPGYTVECGLGQSPLPLSDFESIYRANLGILTLAAVGC